MKRIVVWLTIGLMVISSATMYGQSAGDHKMAHAKKVAVGFDTAVKTWKSYPIPGELEPVIREIVCEVGMSVTDEDNHWIYVEAREASLENETEALDATSSYESYRSFVREELEAFKQIHPDISSEALEWLEERLWERWWWNAIEPNFRQLREDVPTVLLVEYAPRLCDMPSSNSRSDLWRILRGGVFFLGGIAMQAVDATALVPSVGVSGASIASGAGIMLFGLSEVFRVSDG